MGWLGNFIKEGFWGIIADTCSDFFKNAFELFSDLILTDTDMNKYMNINEFLGYFQAIAGSLLVVAVVWEMFKQSSGGMINVEEKSTGTYMVQVIWAAFLIYFLPKSVEVIFLPLNNAGVKLIQELGNKVEISTFQKITMQYDLVQGFMNLGALLLILLLILSIGFIVLGIAAGIRYVELILCVLIAPFCAVSAIKNGDAIAVWVRETTAIVFTQLMQVFLLKLISVTILTVEGPMMILICIGTLVVALRGPQVLRTYLYSTGVGSAGVSAVGGAGRMKAMQFMMKSSVPSGS